MKYMKYLYKGTITFDNTVDNTPRPRHYYIVAKNMDEAYMLLLNQTEVTGQWPTEVTDHISLTRMDPHDVKGLNP